VCQRLLETTLGLSQISRAPEERKQHSDEAQQYGETALANALKSGDMCMAAQVNFLIATVTAWQIYLQLKLGEEDADGSVKKENVEMLLRQRLDQLRKFPQLNIGKYEVQAKTYAGYLVGL
jgi:hypothetical protein